MPIISVEGPYQRVMDKVLGKNLAKDFYGIVDAQAHTHNLQRDFSQLKILTRPSQSFETITRLLQPQAHPASPPVYTQGDLEGSPLAHLIIEWCWHARYQIGGDNSFRTAIQFSFIDDQNRPCGLHIEVLAADDNQTTSDAFAVSIIRNSYGYITEPEDEEAKVEGPKELLFLCSLSLQKELKEALPLLEALYEERDTPLLEAMQLFTQLPSEDILLMAQINRYVNCADVTRIIETLFETGKISLDKIKRFNKVNRIQTPSPVSLLQQPKSPSPVKAQQANKNLLQRHPILVTLAVVAFALVIVATLNIAGVLAMGLTAATAQYGLLGACAATLLGSFSALWFKEKQQDKKIHRRRRNDSGSTLSAEQDVILETCVNERIQQEDVVLNKEAALFMEAENEIEEAESQRNTADGSLSDSPHSFFSQSSDRPLNVSTEHDRYSPNGKR